MSELTFSQAIIVAAVPTIVAFGAAYFSKDISDNQNIYQARMTERDLIQKEATDKNELAYLVPIADNRAWANYYDCRQKNKTRFKCAGEQVPLIPDYTSEIVKNPISGGY